jgi:hypothetical protein
MAIASFSKKVFSVSGNKIYTFSGLQYSSSYATEDQDVEGKKPSTYKKGPGLNTMDFSVKLDAAFKINPKKEINDWESIKDTGIPYVFILGNKSFGKNKWLLVDVSASDMNIDNVGNILSANLSLKFTEYVRSGAKNSSSSGSANKKTKSPGIKTPTAVDPMLLMPVTDEKSATKRYNEGMSSPVMRATPKTSTQGMWWAPDLDSLNK